MTSYTSPRQLPLPGGPCISHRPWAGGLLTLNIVASCGSSDISIIWNRCICCGILVVTFSCQSKILHNIRQINAYNWPQPLSSTVTLQILFRPAMSSAGEYMVCIKPRCCEQLHLTHHSLVGSIYSPDITSSFSWKKSAPRELPAV